jgi:hypothetical protein
MVCLLNRLNFSKRIDSGRVAYVALHFNIPNAMEIREGEAVQPIHRLAASG